MYKTYTYLYSNMSQIRIKKGNLKFLAKKNDLDIVAIIEEFGMIKINRKVQYLL